MKKLLILFFLFSLSHAGNLVAHVKIMPFKFAGMTPRQNEILRHAMQENLNIFPDLVSAEMQQVKNISDWPMRTTKKNSADILMTVGYIECSDVSCHYQGLMADDSTKSLMPAKRYDFPLLGNNGQKEWMMSEMQRIARGVLEQTLDPYTFKNHIPKKFHFLKILQKGKKDRLLISDLSGTVQEDQFPAIPWRVTDLSHDQKRSIFTIYNNGTYRLKDMLSGKYLALTGNNTYPRISKDQNKMLYVHFDNKGNSSVGIYDLNSHKGQIVTERAAYPSWDAQQKAFTYSDPAQRIRLYDLEHKTARSLGPRGIESTLSPDGSALAYVKRGRVFVFDRESGKEIAMDCPEGQCESPRWSPDGVFLSYIGSRQGKVFYSALRRANVAQELKAYPARSVHNISRARKAIWSL